MKPDKCTRTCILFLAVCFMLCNTSAVAQTELPGGQDKQLAEDFAQRATATLKGRVIWEDEDLAQTTVQVYKDEKLSTLYTGVTQLKGGQFEVRVEPGRYYVVAFVDVDRSGKFDSGDGMGILGITDWSNPSQQKQLVKVGQRQTISGLRIIVTARSQEVDGVNKVVSMREYRPDPLAEFKTELATIASGVKGAVEWADRASFDNALVFAYTDLSWKYRAGATRVEADGNFTVHLRPGKYYLMVVIDQNDTNLFDAGDALGIYGISDLRDRQAFPIPILVTSNKFTEDLQIEITGRQLKNGRVIPLLDADVGKFSSEDQTAEVSGTLVWAGRNLNEGVLQVYTDPTLMQAIQQTKTDKDGRFKLQLPPGDYYLLANIDADNDGQYGPGDGLGGYGTVDMTARPPAILTLKEGKNPRIEIVVSARYNAEGQLEPTESEHSIVQSSETQTGISGHIIWDGKQFTEGILSLSSTPDFASPIPISLNLEDDGRYKVAVPPGDYYVMVVVDLDADRKAGLRDGIGIYGTRHPVRGKPQLVAVFSDYVTPHINIEIFALYIDAEGNIAEIDDGHRSEIKFQHGEPEDTFKFTRFGREVEEWWYWTQGVSFTFAPTTSGWKLQDRKDFEPKVNSQERKQLEQQFMAAEPEATAADNSPETTSLNAALYYSYDGIIWGYSPNGMIQPVGAGSYPTAALNGGLVYLDHEGNVMGRGTGSADAELLLSRRELVKEAAISPSGEYIAFTRQHADRHRIYIRHLPTDSEIVLPSTAREMTTPSWNLHEELLAYSTRGSIENPDAPTDRNIYAYDRVNERVEPICISAEDDIEPAWSPSDSNLIAFSRAEGKHRQIWLIRFNMEGEPSERQLTQYGGEKPVWLPDGSTVLYESNGQLWLISPDGAQSRPIFFKGQVLYGREPYAIPFEIAANN